MSIPSSAARGTVTPDLVRDPGPEPRLWSVEAWSALARRITGMTTGGGMTRLTLESNWTGNARWARNRISTSGDQRNNVLAIVRVIRGAGQQVTLNQLDDTSVAAAVRYAEQSLARYRRETMESDLDAPFTSEQYLRPTLWFESTAGLDGTRRADIVRTVTEPAERAGMLSAGYLEANAAGLAVYSEERNMALYYPVTEAQYSVTVRDPKGTGSGWAGVNHSDYAQIDAERLSAIALDKCLRSRNPVAVEPGRYTAILEPQAVYDLSKTLVARDTLDWSFTMDDAQRPEQKLPFSEFYKRVPIMTKIGQRVIDDRLSLDADPMDPALGAVPFDADGEPVRAAVWIRDGVLRRLSHNRRFAVVNGLGPLGQINTGTFRLRGKGPATAVDEMIATTKRGLLITRLSGMRGLDARSMLMSAFTRDGVWLIENGKISKPAKNFHVVESPLLAFNNVEQIGVPQRVFAPGRAAVAPALKIRDFNFASLSDAV